MYKSMICKTALNPLNSSYLPYRWDLNVYRGCAHRCRYCYALYSHEYLGAGDFFVEIFIKENIVELLEKKLRSPYWKRETINLGGVTDSYQPVESEKKLMPEILKLLIKYRTPANISTKSTLILRDLPLYRELDRVAGADIAFSITCRDENIRKKIEPSSPPSAARFAALKEISRAGIRCGVLFMPILPFISDGEDNLRAIYSGAQESGAEYVITGLLNLRGPTRGHFLNFIKNTFPDLYPHYQEHYSSRHERAPYRAAFYEMLSEIKKAYPLQRKKHPRVFPEQQLELFGPGR
ncbi:MAG: radical SAM protein [FCB group bacterium]|nr:radical SAM protein [FCB group bacterium]